MVDDGNDRFADRAFGDDVHPAERSDKRGIHILHIGDTGDAYLWPIRLRLGMSYCCFAGLLRVAVEEDRACAEALSISSARLYSTCSCIVYVRLANGIKVLDQTGK